MNILSARMIKMVKTIFRILFSGITGLWMCTFITLLCLSLQEPLFCNMVDGILDSPLANYSVNEICAQQTVLIIAGLETIVVNDLSGRAPIYSFTDSIQRSEELILILLTGGTVSIVLLLLLRECYFKLVALDPTHMNQMTLRDIHKSVTKKTTLMVVFFANSLIPWITITVVIYLFDVKLNGGFISLGIKLVMHIFGGADHFPLTDLFPKSVNCQVYSGSDCMFNTKCQIMYNYLFVYIILLIFWLTFVTVAILYLIELFFRAGIAFSSRFRSYDLRIRLQLAKYERFEISLVNYLICMKVYEANVTFEDGQSQARNLALFLRRGDFDTEWIAMSTLL